MDIISKAEELVSYAKQYLELESRDENLVKNRLLDILSGVEGEQLS